MNEKLVDVLSAEGRLLHTYPITLDDPEGSNAQHYESKALEAAAYGRLVPDDQLSGLSARMHVSHGGQLEPYGDSISPLSQTHERLEQIVREQAYALWESAGKPDGSDKWFWALAMEQHLRSRSYSLWEQHGMPAGQADENWRKTRDFESE